MWPVARRPPGFLDQLTFGLYIYYVPATVLVFTNRRLLHFSVRRDGSWKKSLRSLRWGDLAEAKVQGWLNPKLRLKYQNGKVDNYWGLRRGDAKSIKLLLPVLLPASRGETSPAQAMSSLCPECSAPLSPGVYQCSRCSLIFKDEKTIVRRSLLIPGGGYFYTGHWFLGVGDFIAEAVLLFLVVGSVLLAFGFLAEPGEPQVTAGVAWFEVAFFGAILGVEKLITIHHCRRLIRDFIPHPVRRLTKLPLLPATLLSMPRFRRTLPRAVGSQWCSPPEASHPTPSPSPWSSLPIQSTRDFIQAMPCC